MSVDSDVNLQAESPILSSDFYQSRLSNVSKHRKPSPIWDLFSVENKPGMLSMLAGKPNPSTFPFEHITLGVRSPETGELKNLTLEDAELSAALQYGMTAGHSELVSWMTEMMQTVHKRANSREEGWRVSLGAGSQDLLYKAFNALLNPGDTILVEGPTYPTIMPILDSMGVQYSIVDADEDGISTSALAQVLANWDSSQGPFPKVLYTVPFGSNPAGVTTSYGRRVEVLRLARQYDLLILEDDPYYFLYYGDSPRPPSYLTLERQMGGQLGRVLRFDSFSKILSAGFRLGWVTGPDAILTAIERHSAVSVVQPSSLSQVIVLKLLKEWGLDGFLAHAERTADFYRQRRDVLNSYLQEHLTGLAEWTQPDASMFFWIKLILPGSNDSTVFIREKAIARGVLVLPGATAFPDGRKTAHVRVSFSLLQDEELLEAVKRLAEVLREENQRVAAPVTMSGIAPTVQIEKKNSRSRGKGRSRRGNKGGRASN
ncbi:kynurenine/alpha-aminoadipate aminotransferase [Coprinopsis sp. MPI-PUGE-AT-0042]|nr:kynurenine/alpha-aminoadipate aminotransferase [Coprinopsis sp. MPI-PUGE-AT-0042]